MDAELPSDFEVTQADFIAALRKVCPALSRSSDVTLETGLFAAGYGNVTMKNLPETT